MNGNRRAISFNTKEEDEGFRLDSEEETESILNSSKSVVGIACVRCKFW
jgi:hypothetical protein